jgi:glycosyltransferase involved in cell wall biosynthesis
MMNASAVQVLNYWWPANFMRTEKNMMLDAQLGHLIGQLILRTDFIPDSEVRYYLSAADFVIQPYRNATQSGVTPLAYHFEKPMLVTNVGGLPDLVPDGKVGWLPSPTHSYRYRHTETV